MQFLSTLSLRRATLQRNADCSCHSISIHALLAESDGLRFVIRRKHRIFLSTLSLRRATSYLGTMMEQSSISIHALLAESDFLSICRSAQAFYFYPRSPCGERLKLLAKRLSDALFLSTLSLRRATVSFVLYDTSSLIFLSTLSLRRATYLVRGQRLNWGISIHALLAESD